MSDYMDARNIGYWLQRIYHDLAGSTMVYMDARKDEYWLQQIYKELTGIDLVGDQRSFDWWSEAIYRHIIGDSSGVKGTVPANVSWQLIYASRASAAYPDGSSALSVEFWIQQAQRVGLEDSTPIVDPLLTDLAAFWKLDEATGAPRLDYLGISTLANNGGVTQQPGFTGNASGFAAASNQYLSRASNANVQAGAGSFTISLFVYPTSFAADLYLIDKRAITLSHEYQIMIPAGGTTIRFYTSSDGGAGGESFNENVFAFALNTWYHVLAYFDVVNGLTGIKVNNGAPATTAFAGPIFNGTAAVFLGAGNFAGAPFDYGNCRLDLTGLWKRLTTSGENAQLAAGWEPT